MSTTVSELTGQPVDTYSEAWRYECECRHILGLPSSDARNALLASIAKQRGKEAADRLRIDAAAIFLTRRQPEDWQMYLDEFTRSVGFTFSEAARIRAERIIEAREAAFA